MSECGKIYTMEQGTEEWNAIRSGKVTASKIDAVLAGGKGVTRANYVADLVYDRLGAAPDEYGFDNKDMKRGREQEEFARGTYFATTGREVQQVGFIDHPSIIMAGCSPDGLVGDDGMTEFKCPKPAGHLRVLETSNVDRKYMLQCQFQLACSGRQWVDYATFDGRLQFGMQLAIVRVDRDDAMIGMIETQVRILLEEVATRAHNLAGKYGVEVA